MFFLYFYFLFLLFFIFYYFILFYFFFSSRRRHTRWNCDWSSDVCSSDLQYFCSLLCFEFNSGDKSPHSTEVFQQPVRSQWFRAWPAQPVERRRLRCER